MVDEPSRRPMRRLASYAIGPVALVVAGFAWLVHLRPSPLSDAQLHEGLAKAVEITRPSFPRVLNETTTAVGTRVDGTTWVFLVQLAPGYAINDQTLEDIKMRTWACSHEQFTKVLSDGVTIRYEYSSAPPDNKFLFAVDIKSCP
jgi:hypothetical protein